MKDFIRWLSVKALLWATSGMDYAERSRLLLQYCPDSKEDGAIVVFVKLFDDGVYLEGRVLSIPTLSPDAVISSLEMAAEEMPEMDS